MQLAPGTVIGSRYRLLSVLGRGGMGTVYLVEHMGTGDRLALKLLHENAARDYESLERFKREARAPAKIQSENVVKVVDADVAPELGGAPFLVMELLTGADLQTLVKQHGRMPGEDLLRFLGQVARALDKAHAIGIVHRDLKPENLFLHHREDGSTVIKILDFGISRMSQASQTSGPAVMTQQGAIMGTPLYMAPEQAVGRVNMIGPPTDLWSLGLIAVYLSTGEHYWQGTTIPDVLAKVLNHAVYPPSSRWPFLNPAFDQWFYRSCARDPGQRFGNASEQIAALHAALATPASSGSAQAGAPLSHQPTMASANGPMTSAPTALALQVPGMPIPMGTPMPGSGPPAIVKPTTDPMLTPPVITPPPPYGAPAPGMRPSYAPGPVGAPPPGYGAPMRPSYPPPVGGSTNEPVTSQPHVPPPAKSALPLIAIAVGALFVTVGAALATWAIASNRTAAGAGSATASVPPSVTLTVPTATAADDDGGLAKLHGTVVPTGTGRPPGTVTGGPTATAPTATATATTTAPTATATATPKQTPKQCREACVKECANEDDEDSCLKQCFLECPPL